jgi:hypothetical protein
MSASVEDLGDDPERVREALLVGYDGDECPLGERPVPDLTPPRRPEPSGLAGREGREVVVVHVPLAGLRLDRVEPLREPHVGER